jgi:hypothetical protein
MAVADLDGDGALEAAVATGDAVIVVDISDDGRNLSLVSSVL